MIEFQLFIWKEIENIYDNLLSHKNVNIGFIIFSVLSHGIIRKNSILVPGLFTCLMWKDELSETNLNVAKCFPFYFNKLRLKG